MLKSTKNYLSISVYALSSLLYFGKVALNPMSMHVGTAGDAEQFMWYLGWFWEALLSGDNPFISEKMNYPSGINLTANTSLMAEGFIFGWLGYIFNMIFVYNFIVFVNIIVSCLMVELTLKELGIRRWLAILMAILSSFIPYTTAHMLGHLNLTTTMSVFIIFYLMVKIFKNNIKRNRLTGIALGVILAFQFYTSLEILATLAFFIFILAIYTAIIDIQSIKFLIKRDNIIIFFYFLVSFIFLALPGLYYFLFGPFYNFESQVYQAKNIYVNDILNFVVPTVVNAMSSESTLKITNLFSGNAAEMNGYIGVPLIITFIWSSVITWKNKYARIISWMIITLAVFSLGEHLHLMGTSSTYHLPWSFMNYVPLLNHALPSRLMFYADVLLVLMIAYSFELFLRESRKRASLIIGVLFIIMFITWLPRIPFYNTSDFSFSLDLDEQSIISKGINSEPTAIFTDDFPSIMGALANNRYSFPTANVYAYNDNKQDIQYYKNMLNYKNSEIAYSPEIIELIISKLKVEKILYIPVRDIAPNELIDAISHLCGEPIKGEHGVYFWDIPNIEKNYDLEISGDVWDIAKILQGGKENQQWVGYKWNIIIQRETTITISAPSEEMLSKGATVEYFEQNQETAQKIYLNPNESIDIHLKAGSYLFTSLDTFIPQEKRINDDTRRLSVLVSVKR
ncbi:hypothetical protein ACLBWT_10705 [Paenibacillus sp. D51F]